MIRHTALFEYHAQHAKLVDFAGFEMPLWYTNTSEEHWAVRESVGIFDVSHMGRVIIKGAEADRLLDYLVPTRAAAQPPGKAFYTLLLADNAGILDDLIVTKKYQNHYLLIVNAATSERDFIHIQKQSSGFDVEIQDVTASTSMIAVQGPDARKTLQPLTPAGLDQLKRFMSTESLVDGLPCSISRTGYTGEDGYEIVIYDSGPDKSQNALRVWNRLTRNSKPCGLGARDSLRLEAGLPLYGSDINESTNPFEADLAWVVSPEKGDYFGHSSLSDVEKQALSRIRRGLILSDKIPRRDFLVSTSIGESIGCITSGTFSPVLRKGIALAYVKFEHSRFGTHVSVDIRGTQADATVTKPPFYDDRRYGWRREKG